VAFSFWGALAALSGLGLRYPLAMVPVLLLQLSYKLCWLVALWLPLQFAGPADGASISWDIGGLDLRVVFIGGAVMDLVVIPWPYVVARFVRAHGDRWSDRRQSPGDSSSSERASRFPRVTVGESRGKIGAGPDRVSEPRSCHSSAMLIR
jgi:hypothetical protein